MAISESGTVARMAQNHVPNKQKEVAQGHVYPEDSTIEVVVDRLDAAPEEIHAATMLLSDTERQRAARFAFDRDRNRFIVARAKLRRLLATRLDANPASVELIYGANGKPSLAPRFANSGLRFNVSHSNDVVVYGFVPGREVGIDVEAVRAMDDADAIAARFFSEFENRAYLALDPGDKPAGFFNCWTRKEAFVKALGEGLSYPLDRFDVSLEPGEPARILRVEDKPGIACGWRLATFSPLPGYVAAIVTQDA